MGCRPAQCFWLLIFVLISFWAAPHLSSPCTHLLHDAAPTASGYLPINESSGSKMFFTYYEAIQQNSTSGDAHGIPILLWLQGGPGCSSMIGNFYEIGPWRVGEDQCFLRNPAPWNRIFGLLFLDSPVGTGFSVAPLVADIPTDQAGVARDVYTAMAGFYNRFPALRNRPFYVTGESYGGKYVPSVAAYILNKQGEQGNSSEHIRLDGIAIGNGLTHPIAQVEVHAPQAYYMGLIDENQKEEMDTIAAKLVAHIKDENWVDAYAARLELLDYLENATGLATLYDVRRTSDYHAFANGTDYLAPFLNREDIRSLLNADLLTWSSCSTQVREIMASDNTKSTMLLVEFLLNQSVPVLLYQGEFDLRDGVASNEAWIRLLQWNGMHGFHATKRKVWKENNVRAGSIRSFSSLTHVTVANAGHLVPADQAYASQRMIETWISGSGIV